MTITEEADSMLFLAVFFLVFALFMAVRVFRGHHAIWLGLALFSFGCSLLGLVGMVPRFGNYEMEGLFHFSLEQPFWLGHLLSRLSLYDFMRFRLWSAFGFIIAISCFAFSYSVKRWKYGEILAATAFIFVAFVFTLRTGQPFSGLSGRSAVADPAGATCPMGTATVRL
jgi:hypothetical protein